MDIGSDTQTIIDKIHESTLKTYIVCSGGGSGIFPLLLQGGGGSKTLLAGHIPYDHEQLKQFLGVNEIEKTVSEETASLMASEAYKEAVKSGNNSLAVGIGLTASLRRVPDEREGRVHEFWLVAESAFKKTTIHFVFDQNSCVLSPLHLKPHNIREIEEMACHNAILEVLAEYAQIDSTFKRNSLEITSVGTVKKHEITDYPINMRIWDHKFRKMANPNPLKLIFPGSFNPPHEGHVEMAKIASIVIKQPCLLEISIQNVDKGELTQQQIIERMYTLHSSKLFRNMHNDGVTDVILTKSPTFVEKSKLFPGATFVIGYDTALRIIDPKYAGPVDDVLNAFENNGTKFILFSRVINGVFTDNFNIFPERFLRLITYTNTTARKYAHLASRDIRKQNEKV